MHMLLIAGHGQVVQMGVQLCLGLEFCEDPKPTLWVAPSYLVSSLLSQNGCVLVKSLVWEVANSR